MTYWSFHLTFILPAIGALLLFCGRTRGPQPSHAKIGFGLVAGMALLYTAPWDHYLIARGVWSYPPDRVSESLRLGLVPLEECCFFVLQPVFTGLCLLCLLRRSQERVWLRPPPRAWPPRIIGGTLALVAGVCGVFALAAGGHWLYLGLILVWGSPPLALHWFYGGSSLWQSRRVLGAGLAVATVYLWAADLAAISLKIWRVSPQHSTGWNLVGLPVEEAVFFVVTNLLVLQGLLLFFQRVAPHTRETLP